MNYSRAAALAVSSNGELTAIASFVEEVVHVWSTADGKLKTTVKLPAGPKKSGFLSGLLGAGSELNVARAIAFHPSQPRLAIVCNDKRLSLIDYAQGALLYTTGETGPDCTSSDNLVFSPDGQDIIHVGKIPGAIHIWDAATGRLRQRITGGHRPVPQTAENTVDGALVDEVEVVKFVPTTLFTGSVFATGGSDGVIRFWQRQTDGRYSPRTLINTVTSRTRFAPKTGEETGGNAALDAAMMQEALKSLTPEQRKLLETFEADDEAVSTSPMNESLMSQNIQSLALSDDGLWMVASSSERIMRIDLQRAISAMNPPADKIEALTRELTGYELDPSLTPKVLERVRLLPVK
jgi:WD40 repeat protein